MKLERLPEYLLVTVVMTLGIGFAIYCGRLTGEGQVRTLGVLFGVAVAAVIILLMRTNLWLLIPLCLPLGGKLVFLPLPFSVADVAILFVFPVFLAFKALKLVKKKPTFNWLDLLLLINLLYLASVFLRNPVGTEALGATKVGGKPYVEVVIAMMAYWVLVRVKISASLAQKLPFLMILGGLAGGALNFITFRFPATAPLLGRIYSGAVAETYDEQGESSAGVDPGATREQFLAPVGSSLVQFLTSRFLPATLLNPLYFGRFALTVLSIIFVMKSGHRITVPNIAVLVCLSTYFRKGMFEVAKIAVIGGVLLAMVIAMHGTLFTLPLTAQRALSFLPGKWDYTAIHDARESSRWRFEMWEVVLTTDRYITNKWLGDGFGFTAAQLQQMSTSSDPTQSQENMLVSGNYHSGPVSTIRFVGYVGLALFILLLIGMACYAWQLIVRARGTPYFTLALFLGMPTIYLPFAFIFIFGAFQNDLVGAIITIALLKLLNDSLEAYSHTSVSAEHEDTAPLRPLKRLQPLAPVGFR